MPEEEIRTYCVYGHQNKINGKWYIGQTKYNYYLRQRWGDNGVKYKSCTKFWNAIQIWRF